jgi:hypothetical protein
MTKKLTAGLAAVAVLTAAVGLATPSLAGAMDAGSGTIKHGTIRVPIKGTGSVHGGGHSTTTKSTAKTK